jgi:hypothetical protein
MVEFPIGQTTAASLPMPSVCTHTDQNSNQPFQSLQHVGEAWSTHKVLIETQPVKGLFSHLIHIGTHVVLPHEHKSWLLWGHDQKSSSQSLPHNLEIDH